MSERVKQSAVASRWWRLSPDAWAVTTAFALAVLVRFGVLKHIPW